MIVIGIDPGLKGGIAILRDGNLIASTLMPTKKISKSTKNELNLFKIREILESVKVVDDQYIAFVERVHSMPKQGVSTTFKFGMGYGKILGLLAGLEIPYELPTPQMWKKFHGLIGKDKDASIRLASTQLDREFKKKEEGICEAYLIAKFGEYRRCR